MSNYIRNQVELLEVLINRKFTNDELPDIFEFVRDVYRDGLGDRDNTDFNGVSDHNIDDPMTKPETPTMETFL